MLTSRLLSIVGAGGVGKTRLAIAVAGDLRDRFGDEVCYVDLEPVHDGTLVPIAVLAALGIVQPPSRVEDALVATIGNRPTLVVLDNCEHLLDAVAVLTERMLARCPQLVILATSRIRMVVPHERVVELLGLSADGGDDAMTLLTERAAAAGWQPECDESEHLRELCRLLDGLPLAIELAAARLPTVGFADLEAGLLGSGVLLSGGARAQERHSSLQRTLDWSHALLPARERVVLRRIAVFAGAFDSAAAADVVGFEPLVPAEVRDSLAMLAEHSLLSQISGTTTARYRLLETVRQYANRHAAHAADLDARNHHVDWSVRAAGALLRSANRQLEPNPIEQHLAEVRAALHWCRSPAAQRPAQPVARTLARMLFNSGWITESQELFEQAALLATDAVTATDDLESAAAVARCRVAGPDALRLDLAAAEAARRSGDPGREAAIRAGAAELVVRFTGMFDQDPADAYDPLITAAESLAGHDQRAIIALALARAHAAAAADPGHAGPAVDAALSLASLHDDRLAKSAALDVAVSELIVLGRIVDAAELSRRRVDLVDIWDEPAAALERKDALHMAVLVHLGAGQLRRARRYAEIQRDLPFLRAERYLAEEELLAPLALSGDWSDLIAHGERFRDGWIAAGRPVAPGRGLGPAAVAMAHQLCGDEPKAAAWFVLVQQLLGQGASKPPAYLTVFDAIVNLHHGRPTDALEQLRNLARASPTWYGQLLSQWHAALVAEAAVLAHDSYAQHYVAHANEVAAGNPIAHLIVQRAAALADADRPGVLATANGFEEIGTTYQAARSRTLADERI